ncbi:MAG: YncE family protein [Mycobacteriaceae bacterium]
MITNHSRKFTANVRLSKKLACMLAAVALFATPSTALANPAISGSTTGPDGLVYIPMYSANTVIGIDPIAQKVVKEYKNVGNRPLVVKMLPDHSKMFVSTFGPLDSAVFAIDMKTDEVSKIPVLGDSYAVAVLSHNGRYFYAPTSLSTIAVIDTQTNKVIRHVPVLTPPGPFHMEASADDSKIYVLSGLGTLTEYDAITGAVLRGPIFLQGIASGWGGLNVSGEKLFSVNFYGGVTIVDLKSWRVDRVMPMSLDSAPISATFTPDGTKMWVCNFGSNEILVMDAHTGHIINVIRSKSGSPVYAGFSADGETAYVGTMGKLPVELPVEIKLPLAMLPETGKNGFFDQYDTETGELKSSMPVVGTPFAGVFPG